ncbi:MAG: YfhO family protein, partial [Oscillospiraceae bacterium]|nr:YfhO family protein [Oscillospiraceae bacterium]
MDNELEILTPETPKKPFYQRFFEDTVVGRALYNRRYGLLIFFLPVFIMWLCYSIFGVHPFGDGSVLVLDLNGQYVSYYEMLRDAIWGDKSLIYSWSRNLGGETMGMFGYYLASPFMWIIVLLPRTMMLGAIEIMQLAKIGCCALAFAYYLKKSKNASNYMQVIFSVTYALMTYIVVELMNPMWIDGMIWLPLIALGIENLVKNGKMLGLVLSLTIMFVSHFYIGYMLGFFSALYFIYC